MTGQGDKNNWKRGEKGDWKREEVKKAIGKGEIKKKWHRKSGINQKEVKKKWL